jgi:hypothetical protein
MPGWRARRRSRWRRRLALAVVLVAALLGGAAALVPRLVDSAAVRRVIERELSARVGGKLRYDSIELRLIPLPRAEIRGVSLYSPETLTGHAVVVDVELSLAALLRGAVRPTAIRVKEPVLEVPFDLEAGHLALRGVVAPFGNVTGALRRVPVVGRLFGARIVGVPFSVSGDWHDPRVTPLGPEAIAGSFVDLLGRALNVPIRLLSPLIPSRERAP